MNGLKKKEYLKIASVILFIIIVLFIIIILNKKENKISNENEEIINQKYKVKLTVNLIDNNGTNELIFSDNNISGVKVTGIDPFSPSIFIIFIKKTEEEKFKNIVNDNIGKKLVLYYNGVSLSSIEIKEEIMKIVSWNYGGSSCGGFNEELNNIQLTFENINDDILLDIVNNIFEYE
jgi:hypothetical protein